MTSHDDAPAARKICRRTQDPARLSKAAQRAGTTERILDAAELLFSQHGLHGVATVSSDIRIKALDRYEREAAGNLSVEGARCMRS